MMNQSDLDQLSINTIRFLAVDAVEMAALRFDRAIVARRLAPAAGRHFGQAALQLTAQPRRSLGPRCQKHQADDGCEGGDGCPLHGPGCVNLRGC